MDITREQLIFRIYEEALALPPAERQAFIQSQCGGDGDLLSQVAACLDAAEGNATTQEQGLAAVIGEGMAAAAQAMDANLPHVGDTLGKYQLLEQIGRGGMGVVFKAEDRVLRRLVALKMIHRRGANDAALLKRFEREGRALAALRHPDIVQVYGLEQINDHLVLVMEYLEGPTLQIPPTGMPFNTFIETACALAFAVAAAHEAGIVHRDLKPANIMVTKTGLKILDFGLAQHHMADPSHAATQRLTASGMVIGTVPYMSPEQARGLPLDPRSDVFSLGVIFYEALTGRRPFTGKTASDVISAILRDDPPPLPPACDKLPDGLIDVLGRCLHKDADQRFASARELHIALNRLHTNRPIPEIPPLTRFLAHLIVFATGACLTLLALNFWRANRHEPPNTEPATTKSQTDDTQPSHGVNLDTPSQLPLTPPLAKPDTVATTPKASLQELILTGNFAAALALLQTEKTSAAMTFSRQENHQWAARLYRLQGQKQRALEELTAAAATAPTNQRTNLALALMEQGFPGRAWELMGSTPRDAEQNKSTALLRALSALHRKQWPTARVAFQQAQADTAPEEWTWWWIHYLAATDPAAATDEIVRFIASEQVKQTRPDRWVLAHLKLAESYRRRHHPKQALEWYDRFLNQWATFPNDETRFAQKQRAQLQRTATPQ